MLVRLLYASRASASVNAEALAAILRQSRANNPALGVTGVLCHSEGVLLQLLEGGRSAVNSLYARILTDPRHAQVELLCYDEIGERRFAGWAMGQVNLSKLNRGLLLKYSEHPTLDPFALAGQASLALFDELMATASIACPPP